MKKENDTNFGKLLLEIISLLSIVPVSHSVSGIVTNRGGGDGDSGGCDRKCGCVRRNGGFGCDGDDVILLFDNTADLSKNYRFGNVNLSRIVKRILFSNI